MSSVPKSLVWPQTLSSFDFFLWRDTNLEQLNILQQWFYFAYFTVEYRLPNPKKACIFPILEIFPQPEDFIGIYSKIQKAKAASKKGNKITVQA